MLIHAYRNLEFCYKIGFIENTKCFGPNYPSATINVWICNYSFQFPESWLNVRLLRSAVGVLTRSEPRLAYRLTT